MDAGREPPPPLQKADVEQPPKRDTRPDMYWQLELRERQEIGPLDGETPDDGDDVLDLPPCPVLEVRCEVA